MNLYPRRLLRTVALMGTLALAVGCTGKETPGLLAAGRRNATASPYFVVTTFPVSTLTAGHFYIQGQLVAEAGLDSTDPLIFSVIDLSTGLVTQLHFKDFVTRAGGLLHDSSLDTETGAFTIDGNSDMLVESGSKMLGLIGKDAEGRSCSWNHSVTSSSYWIPTAAEMATSRSPLLDQLVTAVDTYKSAVNSFTYESPFDYASSDEAFMTLLSNYWTARAADPANAHAAAYGDTFEDSTASLVAGMASTEDTGESNYRGGLVDAAGWARVGAEQNQMDAVDQQLVTLNISDPYWGGRHEDLAYYQHTFLQTSWTAAPSYVSQGSNPTVSRGVYEVRLYQDTGAPLGLWQRDRWDPDGLEPETADPENPQVLLRVEFFDNDLDGSIDDVVQSGYEANPDTSEHETFDDLDCYNHLMTPLSHLFNSLYLVTGRA